jgi:hypothetical protein
MLWSSKLGMSIALISIGLSESTVSWSADRPAAESAKRVVQAAEMVPLRSMYPTAQSGMATAPVSLPAEWHHLSGDRYERLKCPPRRVRRGDRLVEEHQRFTSWFAYIHGQGEAQWARDGSEPWAHYHSYDNYLRRKSSAVLPEVHPANRSF